MSEQLTHFKRIINPDYLGAYSLEAGNDMILTISKVQPEELTTTDGKTKHGLVCYWAEDQLPMVLNKTNAAAIAKLLKENDYTKWAGHRIQIYVDHQVKAFGEIVDGLRIRKKLPEGMDAKEFVLQRVKASIPALLKNHKGDLITILAAIEGVSIAEYKASLNLVKLTKDAVDLLNDEAFKAFFI